MRIATEAAYHNIRAGYIITFMRKKRFDTFILFLILSLSCFASDKRVDLVFVDKSEAKMYLMLKGEIFKEYAVSFGANPIGHKEKEGDERTPEGKYILDFKKPDSSFYRAIHISYPNEEDKARAKENGVNPGGQIMIHGQRNGLWWLSWITQWFNWTDGCIAVTNSQMDEIWSLVDVGTPIEIAP